MPLDLIGLIRASQINPSPGQGFKNYVKGVTSSPQTRMTDYRVTSFSLLGSTPGPGVDIPPFTNVTINAEYASGSKLSQIYDTGYDTRVTVEHGSLNWDLTPPGAALPYVGPWATLRSFSNTFTPTGGTITAVVTLNNWAVYTGTLPPFGASYRLYLPVGLSFQPEPYFNLRAYSGYTTLTILPMREGQPTPQSCPAPQLTYPSDGVNWDDIGNNEYLRGDEIYKLQPPVGPNYYLAGYRIRSGFALPDWWSHFTSTYFAYGLQVEYTLQRQLVDLSWQDTWYTVTNQITNPTGFIAYIYGTVGETYTLRLRMKILAPFTGPTVYSDVMAVTIPYKVVGPGGGAEE